MLAEKYVLRIAAAAFGKAAIVRNILVAKRRADRESRAPESKLP